MGIGLMLTGGENRKTVKDVLRHLVTA